MKGKQWQKIKICRAIQKKAKTTVGKKETMAEKVGDVEHFWQNPKLKKGKQELKK